MSVLQLSRLEKRFDDELKSLKELIGASPVPVTAPVVAAAAAPSVPSELLKDIDGMRAAISKTAAVASDAAGELSALKTLVAQLASKMDDLACKCAAPAPAAPAAAPLPSVDEEEFEEDD